MRAHARPDEGLRGQGIFPDLTFGYTGKGSTGMVSYIEKLRGVTVITTMTTPSWAYRLIFGNAVPMALLRGTFWKIGVKNRGGFR